MNYAANDNSVPAIRARLAALIRAKKGREFQGVLFDVLDEVIFERAAVLRGSYAEAVADAKAMIPVWNADEDQAEQRQASEVDVFVLVDGVLAWSEEEAMA